MKKSEKAKEGLILIFSILLIVVMTSSDLNRLTSISIIGDEFGYWLGGAFFSGVDWRDAARCNGYYSWGYGIILSPLFFFIKNTTLMYQFAIIMNIGMIVLSYVIAYFFVRQILKEESKIICSVISLTSVLYVSHIFYAKLTLAESWLSLLFWLMCFLLFQYFNQPKKILLVPISFVCVYMFFVHQRTIGVLVSFLICITLFCFLQKKPKDLIWVIFLIAVFGLIGLVIKGGYQEYIWGNIAIDHTDVNDFGGQVGKIKYLLSPEGLINGFIGGIGKLFYLGTSSFLLFVIGGYFGLKVIIDREEKRSHKLEVFFIILCLLASVAVSTIFMLYSTHNLQKLFYGRYNEYVISPFILLGMICIYKRKITVKEIFLIIVVYLLIAIGIYAWVDFVDSNQDFNWSSVIGISDIWGIEKDSQFLFQYNVVRAVLLCSLIFIWLLPSKESKLCYITLAMLYIGVWGVIAYQVSDKIMFSFREIQTETNKKLCEYIETNYKNEQVYYIEHAIPYKIDYMQFLFKEKNIIVLEEVEDLRKVEDGIVLTVVGSDDINEEMEQDYDLVSKSSIYYLWEIGE